MTNTNKYASSKRLIGVKRIEREFDNDSEDSFSNIPRNLEPYKISLRNNTFAKEDKKTSHPPNKHVTEAPKRIPHMQVCPTKSSIRSRLNKPREKVTNIHKEASKPNPMEGDKEINKPNIKELKLKEDSKIKCAKKANKRKLHTSSTETQKCDTLLPKSILKNKVLNNSEIEDKKYEKEIIEYKKQEALLTNVEINEQHRVIRKSENTVETAKEELKNEDISKEHKTTKNIKNKDTIISPHKASFTILKCVSQPSSYDVIKELSSFNNIVNCLATPEFQNNFINATDNNEKFKTNDCLLCSTDIISGKETNGKYNLNKKHTQINENETRNDKEINHMESKEPISITRNESCQLMDGNEIDSKTCKIESHIKTHNLEITENSVRKKIGKSPGTYNKSNIVDDEILNITQLDTKNTYNNASYEDERSKTEQTKEGIDSDATHRYKENECRRKDKKLKKKDVSIDINLPTGNVYKINAPNLFSVVISDSKHDSRPAKYADKSIYIDDHARHIESSTTLTSVYSSEATNKSLHRKQTYTNRTVVKLSKQNKKSFRDDQIRMYNRFLKSMMLNKPARRNVTEESDYENYETLNDSLEQRGNHGYDTVDEVLYGKEYSRKPFKINVIQQDSSEHNLSSKGYHTQSKYKSVRSETKDKTKGSNTSIQNKTNRRSKNNSFVNNMVLQTDIRTGTQGQYKEKKKEQTSTSEKQRKTSVKTKRTSAKLPTTVQFMKEVSCHNLHTNIKKKVSRNKPHFEQDENTPLICDRNSYTQQDTSKDILFTTNNENILSNILTNEENDSNNENTYVVYSQVAHQPSSEEMCYTNLRYHETKAVSDTTKVNLTQTNRKKGFFHWLKNLFS